jgi:hypothetical protein
MNVKISDVGARHAVPRLIFVGRDPLACPEAESREGDPAVIIMDNVHLNYSNHTDNPSRRGDTSPILGLANVAGALAQCRHPHHALPLHWTAEYAHITPTNGYAGFIQIFQQSHRIFTAGTEFIAQFR